VRFAAASIPAWYGTSSPFFLRISSTVSAAAGKGCLPESFSYCLRSSSKRSGAVMSSRAPAAFNFASSRACASALPSASGA
jgi:hypothetical protein